jgi:hypothetical protein
MLEKLGIPTKNPQLVVSDTKNPCHACKLPMGRRDRSSTPSRDSEYFMKTNKVICKVTFSFTPIPSFNGICKVRKFYHIWV